MGFEDFKTSTNEINPETVVEAQKQMVEDERGLLEKTKGKSALGKALRRLVFGASLMAVATNAIAEARGNVDLDTYLSADTKVEQIIDGDDLEPEELQTIIDDLHAELVVNNTAEDGQNTEFLDTDEREVDREQLFKILGVEGNELGSWLGTAEQERSFERLVLELEELEQKINGAYEGKNVPENIKSYTDLLRESLEAYLFSAGDDLKGGHLEDAKIQLEEGQGALEKLR